MTAGRASSRALAVLLAIAFCLVGALALAGPSDGLPKTETPLDRATPRRAIEGFLEAGHAGDFLRAAHYLDLRAIARKAQPIEGPVIAEKLAVVIERKLPVDVSRVPDVPEGDPATKPPGSFTIGSIFLDEEPIAVSLTRVRFDDGVPRWVISRTTVSMAPSLYAAFGPHGWQQRLPPSLTRTHLWGLEAWQWIGLIGGLLFALVAGHVVGTVVTGIARRIARRTHTKWDDELVEASRGPTRTVASVIAIRALMDPLRFTPAIEAIAHHVSFTLLVIGLSWFAIRALDVLCEWVISRLPDVAQHDAHARSLRTQLAVLQRVGAIITVVIACALILIQFDFVRSVGVSLLASAGVFGIVFGIAAQKSLAHVVAGIQLSVSQPIRIGDTVVTEGEFGTIEEINLTYVVMKVWDERRLVVPITRFLEHPFQNWTRLGSQVHGTVLLQADYTVPVDAVRAELTRICEASDWWDHRTCSLAVTDVTDRCATLRALVSAADASASWNLRCEVRENLLRFLSTFDDGRYLPQLRNLARSVR